MTFIPESSPERSIAFNTIRDAARMMLDNPRLADELGEGAVARYQQILDGVFLPDISREGIVRLPAEQRDTDNIPVIPMLASDRLNGGLRMAGSMYGPTHSRLEALHRGISARRPERFNDTRARLSHQGLAIAHSFDSLVSDLPSHTKARTGLFIDQVSEDEAVPLFAARPHVAVRHDVASGSPITAGITLAHELGHTDHIAQTDALPEGGIKEFFTRSELEMNDLTMSGLRAARVAANSDFIKKNGFTGTRNLDDRRRVLNADGDPYEPKPELTDMVLSRQLRDNPVKVDV